MPGPRPWPRPPPAGASPNSASPRPASAPPGRGRWPARPPSLAWLSLGANALGLEGALALATSAGLGRLTSLGLQAGRFDPPNEMLRPDWLHEEGVLNLRGCSLGDEGVERLAASPALAHFT